MGSTRQRGRIARLGVVAATVAVMGVVAVPAHAQQESGYFAVGIPATTIGGQGSPGKAVPMGVQNINAVDPKVTFDLSGLAGVVTAELDPEFCTVNGSTGSCTFPDDPQGEGYYLVVPLLLRPAAGAESGDRGTLSWRTSAANDLTREYSVVISVADGVDIVVVGGDGGTINARPGEEKTVPIVFGNAGNQTAPQVQLIMSSTAALDLTRYVECEYAENEFRETAVCLLDVAVAPGEGLEVDFEFTPNTAALDEDLVYFVAPPGTGWLALPKSANPRRGADRSLTVRKVALAQTAEPGEIDRNDNFGSALVDVANTADLAVTGATLHGALGQVVPAPLRLTNLGPATIQDRSGEVGAAVFEFVVPEGTEVTGVPQGCFSLVLWRQTGKKQPVPGAPQYLCGSGQEDFQFSKGEAFERTFQIKITEVVLNAEGQVQTFAGDTIVPPYDDKPANNIAKVVVNPASGGPPSGRLPITGTPIGPLALVGALLLAAGSALVLLARRRRSASGTTTR
ncbi:MAG TPA: LPXTG cell wall anchor domain-containing protein [Micromonosporaceae bacterium]|nr:LPXTG cell wall anchor domain-containing protein [Micromonosporaceae bacterium]